MSIGLWLLSLLSFVLEAAVVTAILRSRQYRRFPLVLAQGIFGALVVVVSLLVLTTSGVTGGSYALMYTITDVVNHGLIIALLLSLAADALSGSARGTRYVWILTASVLAFSLGSLAVFYHGGQLQWTLASRNL